MSTDPIPGPLPDPIPDADPTADTDLWLRPGEPGDMDPLASLFVAARRAAYPAMPPTVHTETEIHAWFGALLDTDREVWVAESGAGIVGYAVLTPQWLDSLYVAPELTGRGIGSLLLDLVKSLRPDGFGLWVFASNHPARRFYARHGLVEVGRTDGAENEERAPDVELAWPGAG